MNWGAILVTLGLVIGLRLGWESDWYRRLFRLGPYRRKPKIHRLD